jgi:hypothetical protein
MTDNATQAVVQAKPKSALRTPWRIARDCLTEAHDDLEQAKAIAGKRARGANLRAVISIISDAHWRATRE